MFQLLPTRKVRELELETVSAARNQHSCVCVCVCLLLSDEISTLMESELAPVTKSVFPPLPPPPHPRVFASLRKAAHFCARALERSTREYAKCVGSISLSHFDIEGTQKTLSGRVELLESITIKSKQCVVCVWMRGNMCAFICGVCWTGAALFISPSIITFALIYHMCGIHVRKCVRTGDVWHRSCGRFCLLIAAQSANDCEELCENGWIQMGDVEIGDAVCPISTNHFDAFREWVSSVIVCIYGIYAQLLSIIYTIRIR